MLGDHQPIVLGVFNGLFDRSSFNDSVPTDHGSIAQNIEFTQLGYRTRRGTSLVESVGAIRRLSMYKRKGEVPRILILDDSGNLYDSLDLNNPILSIEEMVDFSAAQYFDRIYITPHNRITGIENEVVYVYDGTTCRQAGGIAPSGSITVTNSTLSGNVEAGTHLIAVAFETESGFITRPGPSIYGQVLADGTHQIDISGIPIGPDGTVARHILATRRIPNYDGNQSGYEFFFVPTGRIAGNSITTATLNFFDADLLKSADYLFDQLQTIPAGVGIGVYQNSLVVWGSYNEPSRVSISRAGEPESFDSVEGFLNIAPTEAGGVKSCTEFRDSLYIMKSRKTYQTSRDYANPNSPIFWKVNNIDEGIGTEPFGLCEVLDTKGPNLDNFLIASQLGLVLFNGVFVNPVFSWKIDSFWDSIDRDRFNEIQVFNDPTSQRFYILLPDGAILVGDYQNGLGSDAVRWSIWVFPWNITAICLDVNEDDKTSRLLIAGDGNVFELDPDANSDNGVAIDTHVRYAPRSLSETGTIETVGGFRIRAKGVGTLKAKLLGEDNVDFFNIRDITLTPTPGHEFTRKTNFNNEKAAVDLQVNLFGHYIEVHNVKLYVAPMWLERPNV